MSTRFSAGLLTVVGLACVVGSTWMALDEIDGTVRVKGTVVSVEPKQRRPFAPLEVVVDEGELSGIYQTDAFFPPRRGDRVGLLLKAAPSGHYYATLDGIRGVWAGTLIGCLALLAAPLILWLDKVKPRQAA